jgi:hypothetical protein
MLLERQILTLTFISKFDKIAAVSELFGIVVKKMRCFKTCLVVGMGIFFAFFGGSGIREASAFELGLTPSHVYGLWTNINKCLLIYAEALSEDETLPQSLSKMASSFEGKVPADVYKQAKEIRKKLETFIAVPRGFPEWLNSYNPQSDRDAGQEEITPSNVFIESSHILNGVVDVLVAKAGDGYLVSGFYANHSFVDKTPSDVFGLVDLAKRRVDMILKANGSGLLEVDKVAP